MTNPCVVKTILGVPKSRRPTLSDLAKSLDLSICTVSKILNTPAGGDSYALATVRRVRAAAARLGYEPNAQARALRTRRSGLIGLILPSARHAFFGELTDQLELRLRAHGLYLMVGHSRGRPEEERQLVRSFLGRGLDGIFWIPSRERPQRGKIGLPGDYPLVILDQPLPRADAVVTDNLASSRELGARIHACGHRRILALNASRGDRGMKERQSGLEEVFGAGVEICDTDNSPEAAREALTNILGARFRFTALVALSEPLALGALAALRDHGIAMPRRLSFAAFDDFPLAAHWSPRITVVRQDVAGLARQAAQKMIHRLASGGVRPTILRVPAILAWRESIATVQL